MNVVPHRRQGKYISYCNVHDMTLKLQQWFPQKLLFTGTMYWMIYSEWNKNHCVFD